MARDRSDLEKELAQLPPEERARLALALIESLEPRDDGDVADAWRVEAERREEAIRRGAHTVAASEVFAKLRRQSE